MNPENRDSEIQREKEEEENISSKILSFYLIWSVLISITVIAIGVLEYLVTSSTGYAIVPLDQLIKSGGVSTNVFPHYLGTIGMGVLKVKAFAIIQLGILLLILSPIGRIFIQILIYARERDRAFVVISTVVFFILLLSLYLSKFIA